jgi:hypothetical protein
VANCSDFAGVLTYNNSGTSFIWDGSFIQNDIPEDTPAFGPFAVDLGNGWTGSAHMNCAKTNPGDGSIDFGGFLVTLSNGPASLQLNYVASDADGDPAINGELRLALSSVSYHSSTPNCPPSGACDSPGTQAVTGETILNDVCCRNVDTCRVGTPQPGSDDGPTAMGECA